MNVSMDSSIKDTIAKFVIVKRHRMFVRKDKDLIGIVTSSDVLKAFASAQ
jgi:predicted transcriptional regulator